jgi:cation:H+ antiporter
MADLSTPLMILFGLLSITALVVSANISVKKIIGIAQFFHLSTTFMGMTVLSLATSIPEITSHFTASINILAGNLDYKIGSAIVLGSNIGSDNVQQTLIMGIVVLLSGTIYFRRYFIKKSMIPMIGTALICVALGLDGTYSRLDGIVLFGLFIAYTYYLYIDERKHYKKEDKVKSDESKDGIDTPQSINTVFVDSLITLAMIVITIFSASIVLNITEIIVQRTGVGGSLFGVMTLGVASAMPELFTALAGIRHNHHGVSLGTLIGSNITNPLVAIGGGAMLSTYSVPQPVLLWDLPFGIFSGIVLWIILWFSKGKLKKIHAFYLIVIYFAYLSMRVIFFNVD